MNRCKSCGAPIQWAVSDGKRKMMPLDPDPSSDGNVQVLDRHFATHRGTAWLVKVLPPVDCVGPQVDGEPLYTSHFATCPDADRHRRRN